MSASGYDLRSLDECSLCGTETCRGGNGPRFRVFAGTPRLVCMRCCEALAPAFEAFAARRTLSPAPPRWALVGDGDGHTWLVPAERRAEALAAIEGVGAYWAWLDRHDCAAEGRGERCECDPPTGEPDVPDWFRQVAGPFALTFCEPREDA